MILHQLIMYESNNQTGDLEKNCFLLAWLRTEVTPLFTKVKESGFTPFFQSFQNMYSLKEGLAGRVWASRSGPLSRKNADPSVQSPKKFKCTSFKMQFSWILLLHRFCGLAVFCKSYVNFAEISISPFSTYFVPQDSHSQAGSAKFCWQIFSRPVKQITQINKTAH